MKYKIFKIGVAFIFLMLLISCEDDTYHRKVHGIKEVTHTTMFGKVMFHVETYDGIKTIKASSDASSLDANVNGNVAEVEFDNLEAGRQVFTFTGTTADGVESSPLYRIVSVMDNSYLDELNTIKVAEQNYGDGVLTLNFEKPGGNHQYTVVSYFNTNGEALNDTVFGLNNSISLNAATDYRKTYALNSYYKVNNFFEGLVNKQGEPIKFDKITDPNPVPNLKRYHLTHDEDGTGPAPGAADGFGVYEKLFDGEWEDRTNFWASQLAYPLVPTTFTIELEEPTLVSEVVLHPKNGNTKLFPKTVKVYGLASGIENADTESKGSEGIEWENEMAAKGWEELGSFTGESWPVYNKPYVIKFEGDQEVKYLRLLLMQTWNVNKNNVMFGEMIVKRALN
ncbi:MAG: hypothetical protein N4A71_26660 [Carboxylicivirga sp.]|jgi:hypothetical protein|nr:hypothetical protein [Carboxylicivirga sp.]